VILTGLDHSHSIVSTESSITVNPDSNHLDALARYNIVASLRSHQRILLLWDKIYPDGFITKALTLSVVRDILRQLTGFAGSARKLLAGIDAKDIESIDTLLKAHLPCLSDLFSGGQTGWLVPAPKSIQEVFQWVLSFTAQQRRLDGLIRSKIANKQGSQHLEDYAPSSSFNDSALIHKISKLTETPENIIMRGQMSATDAVLQTRFCAPQEWDKIVRSVEKWRERMKNDVEGAQKQLRKDGGKSTTRRIRNKQGGACEKRAGYTSSEVRASESLSGSC